MKFRREYRIDEYIKIVDFFKDEQKISFSIGVTPDWRLQKGNAITDPRLQELVARADIVHPWQVGRYRDEKSYQKRLEENIAPDIRFCADRGQDFIVTIYPGFSWHNMKPESQFDLIPRKGGEFFWMQVNGAIKSGAKSIYVAMFDEIDEGTAIFKCSTNPPTGESPFVSLAGVPSDHYLWLAGEAGKVLRGEKPLTEELPVRENTSENPPAKNVKHK